jgi:hypothetical protein
LKGYVTEVIREPQIIIPVMTITNWSGFTNQPTGDGVEIGSDSASDTGKCTIWGTDADGVLQYETVTLTGATYVSTTRTDWANIYSVFLGDADGKNITRAVGTVTVREASGNAAITTITATNFQKGMAIFEVLGKHLDIVSFSGNLWWSNLDVATSNIGVKETGQVEVSLKVTQKYWSKGCITLISDNTGASTQVIVYGE